MQITRYAASALTAAALVGAPSLAHAQAAQTPAPAATATNDDVASLRRDMEAMKQEYEARISALEARIAEQDAAQSSAAAAQAAAASPADQSVATAGAPAPCGRLRTSRGCGSKLFGRLPPLPARHHRTSTIPASRWRSTASSPPRAMTPAPTNASQALPPATTSPHPERGFSLGESEVSFSANIDPTLAGFFDFSINNANEVDLERLTSARRRCLAASPSRRAASSPASATSTNATPHDWNFSDASLPYRAFLNNQFGDDGVQVRWIAPTDQFLEFGAEAFRGDEYPAAGAADNGVGAYSAFVHTGSDIDASSSYLAALSYLHIRSVDRTDASGDLFTGDADLGIASLVYKWAPNGNPLVNNLVLAGEYFYGRDSGDFNGVDIDQAHQGWYVQGVYQFMPQWSVGLRASGLSSDSVSNLLAGTELDDLGHNPLELTALLEYDTSEFGRIRFQYSHDESSSTNNDVLMMQYTVIYGPHGAHRY